MLRNCQKDLRTATFHQGINFFAYCAMGVLKLEDNKVAKFANGYRVDSNFLRQNIEKLKKSLPPKFAAEGLPQDSYENEPDEKAIWFIKMFAQKDKAGNIKIFSAYKVTFEGIDATIGANRINPKITKIDFITDKPAIQALEKKLKSSPPVQY